MMHLDLVGLVEVEVVVVMEQVGQWGGTRPYDALGAGVLLAAVVRAHAHRDLDRLDIGHAARQGGRPG